MKYIILLLACLFVFNVFANKPMPIRIGYDRRPIGVEINAKRNWYSDINRLTRTGFPFVKVPGGKKELTSKGLTASSIKKTDCIYLIGGGDKKTAPLLRKFVAAGGGLVVMGLCDPALVDILPVKLLGNGKPTTVKSMKDVGFKLILPQEQNKLTQLWRENKTGLLIPNRGSIMRVEKRKNARILAEFIDSNDKKYPALVEWIYGKGKVIYFAGCSDRNLPRVSKIFNYPLNTAWKQHSLWDSTILTWISSAAGRADVVQLVYDYQEYMRFRSRIFGQLHELLSVNDIIRISNRKQADRELDIIKKAFWGIERVDKIIDTYKIAEGIEKLKKLSSSLPKCSRIVKPGPKAKSPTGENFYININMDDLIYLQGAYNQDFLIAYHQKLQKDFGGVLDSEHPYIHPYKFVPNKSLSKANPSVDDFKFDAIALEPYRAAQVNVIPVIMQQGFTWRRRSFKKNPLFRKILQQVADAYSPRHDPWTKPFYKALGKYAEKEKIVTGIEFLNEPSLRGAKRKNRKGVSLLKNDFREWLKRTYGSVNELNKKFPLELKNWKDLPDFRTVEKRLKKKNFARQGQQLSTEAGVDWQICIESGIDSLKKLKTFSESKWKKIVVPGFFENVVGSVNGIFWYKTVLDIKPGEIISFTGIDDNAKVYIKGKCVASNEGYNTPFNVHIPLSLLYGSEKITLYVRVEDTGGSGGIWGEVFISNVKPGAMREVAISKQTNKDRLFWGLWGDFLTAYQVEGCTKFASWVREETSKPIIDRSRGATFDSWVPFAEMSKVVDVFGPHVSPSLALDYAEGLNFSKHLFNSEYYPAGYTRKDPVKNGSVSPKRFWGAFYLYHARAAYREAGLVGNRFWETVARGFNGIGMFSPLRFSWNVYSRKVPGITNESRLAGYYRFEPRTGFYVVARYANYYKHIYPAIRGSKPDHRLYIYSSPGTIKQSQLGDVNNQHTLKMEARALYNFLTEDIGEQVGIVNAEKVNINWKNDNLKGRVVFIPYGEFFGEQDLQILKNIVKRGGAVVAFGPLGLYDGYGRNMAEKSSKLTNLKKLYKASFDKKKCYAFTTKSKVKPLIPGTKSAHIAYCSPFGKGNYYQFGTKPSYIKRPKGFDNVDEAWLKNKTSIQTTNKNLYYRIKKTMEDILKKEKARSGFRVQGTGGKIFVRKKGNKKLLFVFNKDLLEARELIVTFPKKYQVELLYDLGARNLGKLKSWKGSISPGGCRILRLTP